MLTSYLNRQHPNEVKKRDWDIIRLFDLALSEHIPVRQVAPYFDDQINTLDVFLNAGLLPEPGQVGPVGIQFIGGHLVLELKRELCQGVHEMVGIRGDL